MTEQTPPDNPPQSAPPAPDTQSPKAHARNLKPLIISAIAAATLASTIGLYIHLLMSAKQDLSPAGLEKICRIDSGVVLRKWSYIIIHHSGGQSGDAETIEEFHRIGRRWQNGLGYDFVIGNGSRTAPGLIEVSDRWRQQIDGAHCKADDMNKKAIGICFVGNYEETPEIPPEQYAAGEALVKFLMRKFSVPRERVLGHREVSGAQTVCPGSKFPLENLRRDVCVWP